VFVGVSVDDTDERARRFVAQKGLAFANGRDPGMKIARAYGVSATPTTFFITPGGEILSRQNGTFPEGEFVAGLQHLLDYKGP
jgi:peroxiredoxin